MSAPYLYTGLEASLYDCLDELSDFDDFGFYRWFAEAGAGPVLDVACGTGRLLRPLRELGLNVTGIDASPEMLAACKASLKAKGMAAPLHLADMRDFSLGEQRFCTVAIPGYSAQLLLDDADLRRCFECCGRHLSEGGQLIVSTYMPWEMVWDGRRTKPMEERRRVDLDTGETVVASQGWHLDTVQQRLRLDNRFERFSPEGARLECEDRSMTIRWDLPHDMLSLLGKAGFADVSLYGDYTFEPPDEESESILYVARVG